MKQLNYVRVEQRFDDYIKNLAREVGMDASLKEWNTPVESHGPLILNLNQDHVNECKMILSKRTQKTVIAINARRDFKLVAELNESVNQIFGFIDLTQELNYNVPLLKNYLQLAVSASEVQLDSLASDMDKLYEYTKSELTRVKDLHDRLVKVRTDNFKGVTITSKFMAGEKSGGEFFDILQSDNQILFLMAGTNNYIVSSMILAEMEVLKMSTPTTTLSSQCEHFEAMIAKHAADNKAELTYCLATINLKNLTATLNCKGNGNYFFHGKCLPFESTIELKLKPGEKFALLSHGAVKNLAELNAKLSPEKFFANNQDKNTKDLINEFFFEVSRNKAGNFLNTDALMAVVELDQKTLYTL